MVRKKKERVNTDKYDVLQRVNIKLCKGNPASITYV